MRLRKDDRRPFYELVEATKQEMRAAISFRVRMWAYEEAELGNEPELRDFLDRYSEWDRETLHEMIEEEINNVRDELFGTRTAMVAP